jgi:hypothetical protein
MAFLVDIEWHETKDHGNFREIVFVVMKRFDAIIHFQIKASLKS